MRIYLCSVCSSSTFIACRFVQNPPQKLQGMRFIGICKICFGFKLFLPTFTQSWFCCCCFNWLWILWSFPFCILVSLLWFGVIVLASGTAATAAPLLHCLVVSLALGVFYCFCFSLFSPRGSSWIVYMFRCCCCISYCPKSSLVFIALCCSHPFLRFSLASINMIIARFMWHSRGKRWREPCEHRTGVTGRSGCFLQLYTSRVCNVFPSFHTMKMSRDLIFTLFYFLCKFVYFTIFISGYFFCCEGER